ncbi:MAG: host-nuclease inhibitor Gam family protein [Kiritimatiellaeota bacterium]|nr:host-nuclease inhibitor Gam family protein [Kiritimatiellota bacterium]
MSKRLKITGSPILSRDAMERLVGEICELTIRRDTEKLNMDEEMQHVRDRHQVSLCEVEEQLEAKLVLAKDWSERNPEEFGARKSIDMTHGTVGFRTGQPKLKTLAGWTWERVKDTLGLILPDYIRTKAEVDKERLLADREALADVLRKVGVRVEQDESFFVDPKREPLEAKVSHESTAAI